MQRTTPPFRADHVGSLLRPPALKEARARRQAGEIDAAALKEIEDREIERVIAKQESIGLSDATDGEFRRAMWHFDFLERLDGVESYTSEHGIKFKGIETVAKGIRVVGKVGFSGHPMLDHFRFLKAHTRVTAKMTIPSPTVLHYRGGRKAIAADVYPQLDEFFRDVADAYKQAIAAFFDAGCRYLQLDDVNMTYLCDPEQLQMLRDRGDNPDGLLDTYVDVVNRAIAGRPQGMAITMHMCRGNFRSHWIAQGGYEPVAETLFNKLNIDGYFMEWDSERAGGFEPLRFVPKDKIVVLGLITSKTPEIESKDLLKRRIAEAAKYVDPEQLCLSPQCGFASTEEGNLVTEDVQWAKLSLALEVAREIWG